MLDVDVETWRPAPCRLDRIDTSRCGCSDSTGSEPESTSDDIDGSSELPKPGPGFDISGTCLGMDDGSQNSGTKEYIVLTIPAEAVIFQAFQTLVLIIANLLQPPTIQRVSNAISQIVLLYKGIVIDFRI